MVANPQSGSSSTILNRIYNYYCKGSFRQVHYLATVDGKLRAASWTKAQSKSYPTRKHIGNIPGTVLDAVEIVTLVVTLVRRYVL